MLQQCPSNGNAKDLSDIKNGNNHRNVLTWQQNLVVIPIVETCGEKDQEEEKLSAVQLLA